MKATGDRYGGLWPAEQLAKFGISYEPSPLTKSELYGALLRLLNSRRIELLDHPIIDPSDVVFIAAPRQAMALRIKPSPLFDSPVIMAAALPDKTLIACAPGGIYYGYDGGAEVDSSREAVIHMEDTTPLPLIGSTGTVAAPQRSAFQTDVIFLRCRARCAWVAYPGAVQVVQGVNWP